jgi:Holliday junction resolvasome RuvABC ATP-dependent DNA helicase subunit
MSIFGDLDMDKVANDPWTINDGTYRMITKEVSAGLTNKGDKKGITFQWEVLQSDDDPQMVGRKYNEWLEIPQPDDPDNMTDEESRKASRVKSRMLSLGVPAAQVNTVTTGELTGIEAIIRLSTTNKNGTDYQNIRDLKLVADGTGGTDDVNPFANANGLGLSDPPF